MTATDPFQPVEIYPLNQPNAVALVIKRLGIVISALIIAAVLLLVLMGRWEFRSARSGLDIAIHDIATTGEVVSENIEFLGDVEASDFSTEYEVLRFDNILFWGYSFDVRFAGGAHYQFDVFPSLRKETRVRAQPFVPRVD
jgi:hypothetical protein